MAPANTLKQVRKDLSGGVLFPTLREFLLSLRVTGWQKDGLSGLPRLFTGGNNGSR